MFFFAQCVGKSGRVYAFEANPKLVEVIRENVSNLECTDQVEIHSLAVFSENGQKLEFEVDPSYYAAASRLLTKGAEDYPDVDGEFITVSTVTLDRFCEERALAPRLVKIDVEGAEIEVLRGAQNLADQKATVFLVEYSPSREASDDVVEWLRSRGYSVFDLNIYREVSREFYVKGATGEAVPRVGLFNVIAVPKDLVLDDWGMCWRLERQPVNVRFKSYRPSTTIRGLMSEPIRLETGTYIVSLGIEGPDNREAWLKIHAIDETVAYFQASISKLKKHSCSSMVIEISKPSDIRIEYAGPRCWLDLIFAWPRSPSVKIERIR